MLLVAGETFQSAPSTDPRTGSAEPARKIKYGFVHGRAIYLSDNHWVLRLANA
jgi:hypothetical protein